jgi:hypothetical protein
MREFAAFYLFPRTRRFNVQLYGRRLFQEYCCDLWAINEQWRLSFIKNNQGQLRAESVRGLMDALPVGEDPANIGQRVYLPASFTNGPRFMWQNYQDAIGICRFFGNKVDYFITMTANPKWKEVQDNLLPGQRSEDRPDLIVRVFHLKLKELLRILKERQYFGKYL